MAMLFEPPSGLGAPEAKRKTMKREGRISDALNQWRAKIATWRKPSTRQAAISIYTASALEQVKSAGKATLLNGALVAICSLVWGYFELFSLWWVLTASCILGALFLVQTKHYLYAATVLAFMASSIVVISVTASYLIASDQNRFRYRTVEGASYLEFPQQQFLMSLAKWIGTNRLITVTRCDDLEVAVLPRLPYEPIFREHDIIDNVGFRRFPRLRFHGIDLGIMAKVDLVTNDAPHRGVGFAFRFSSGDDASIPLTSIFPRSLKCQLGSFPLLPLLEVLPWIPDQTNSLIKAVTRIDRLRALYPDHPVYLDDLRQMRLTNDDTAYSALLDVLTYSLASEMFDGNVFAEMRAQLGRAVCKAIDSHRSIFQKPPFDSLSENFIRHLVAEFGANVKKAMPECHPSDATVRSYQVLIPGREPIPFLNTFQDCLMAHGSMRECLAKSDAAGHPLDCSGLACGTPTSLDGTDELLLEMADRVFDAFVADKDGKLVALEFAEPSDCPELRDSEEERHFVDWWTTHAKEITTKPAECTPTWQAQYAHSREYLRGTLACARKWQLKSNYQEEGPDLADVLYAFKCDHSIDRLSMPDYIKQFAHLFEQLDLIIDDLQRYSALIDEVSGDSKSRSLVKAFRMFKDIKMNACGERDIESCAENYRVWKDYDRLKNALLSGLGLSNLNDADEPGLIAAFAKLDNVVVDMAICDALQDEDFSRRAGYERAAYCDSRNLSDYRLLGTEQIWRSFDRADELE